MEYIKALEQERQKILAFQRELPLCLELVTQALEACKYQLYGTTTEFPSYGGQSESSEQTTSDCGPILEEFIPIKTSCNSADEEEEELESHKPKISRIQNNDESGKKSDWLRSVQLWNQTPPDPPTTLQSKKVSAVEVKKNGGAFRPFQREKAAASKNPATATATNTVVAPATSACSIAERAEADADDRHNKKDYVKERLSRRKTRRCWSPELHRLFLNALQQLGGSNVATPKQIKELMKVDGLTNDEVKSHLQKYRLHTGRPTTTGSNANPLSTPRFVVTGGIRIPPSPATGGEGTTIGRGEAAGATPVGAPAGVYVPVAAPQGVHSSSNASSTSSSTPTFTASL
ncbi:transcription factor [Dionaea muscipula]